MPEELQLRSYGDRARPTLVFLPGLHGDWTLIGGFRRALGGRVRFVEITYPRTLEWSLDDYAAGVEAALRDNGIAAGWLLGESFSSQVVWSMVARGRFAIEGIILAGGFVRHPMRWGARFAGRVAGGLPLSLLTRIFFGYAKIARFRFRRSPETIAGVHEFISRRTEPDRQAAVHRLHLIARSDLRAVAREVRVPLYGLSGILDPIVPWIFVRPALRRGCPALREYRILWHADHNVLGTAPDASADLVARWMGLSAQSPA